ncbi:hypothetical protein EAF00_002570 [Botryotinia globosa]|nr:hypothetical protein EAF00_002570 [Botryotinia globosa]
MLEHTQKNLPGFKWTVYIEDDTFVFWSNLLPWLATLSADDEPAAYYGASAGESNATFAQGGSGIVFSRLLMKSVFTGPKTPTLQEYAKFTAGEYCGDMVLGKVLRDHNKTGFDEFSWCKPVFTFHHLHQRDLVQLALLERQHSQNDLVSRPMIFRDFFLKTISPYLKDCRDDWDNSASRHKVTENITTITNPPWSPPAPVVEDEGALEQTCTSPEACLAAWVALSIHLPYLEARDQ